jgi:hypothetical protein
MDIRNNAPFRISRRGKKYPFIGEKVFIVDRLSHWWWGTYFKVRDETETIERVLTELLSIDEYEIHSADVWYDLKESQDRCHRWTPDIDMHLWNSVAFSTKEAAKKFCEEHNGKQLSLDISTDLRTTMKEKTKYKAKDGTEFRYAEDCMAYDSILDEIDVVMSSLAPRPENSRDFDEGRSYIQHDKEAVLSAKMKLCQLCMKHDAPDGFLHIPIRKPITDEGEVNMYAMLSITGDASEKLKNTWNRFMCIDKEYREWKYNDKYYNHAVT